MGRIQVLSEQLANKIAAGEVVERPASVVKELLENALDAGARSVRVEVEGGGATRLRVSDDGCGMGRDDALLSLERHATSKLRDPAGLSAIATLGFRGEALPAIAAVSRLTLETACRPEDTSKSPEPGVRIEVTAGRMQAVSEAGLPYGTSVTVAQLFLNIPARRKFLKSEATELGHITTLVTHYALAYPEIQFRLETPHRTLLTLPPMESHDERLRQILGEEVMERSVAVQRVVPWAPEPASGVPPQAEEHLPGLGIHGFASRPEVHKLNRESIFIFVNRRLVRDRLLHHAITAAYYNLLPNGVFPAVLLFLDLPYGEVDVNVHPAKTEVRFRRQNFIHDAVRDALRETLAEQRPTPSFLRERQARATAAPAWQARPPSAWSEHWPEPRALPASPGADPALGIRIADLPPGFQLTPAPIPPQEQRLSFASPMPEATSEPAAPPLRSEARPAAGWVPETGIGCGAREHLPPPSGETADELAQLEPLGQIQDSFIVATGSSGLWLIDQHVAHERVLFERVLRQRAAGAIESQRLLLPQVVELDPGRWVGFADLAPELTAAGFEAEPFGRTSVAVQAAPAGVAAEQIERLLQEILQITVPEERGLSLERIRTRISATIACHAAIKINTRLEPEKMRWLLAQLAETQYPMTCPHGRPVLLRYTLEEIQRAFKRLK